MKIKRCVTTVTASLLAFAVAVAVGPNAQAITVSISPSSQTHNHGVAATWGAAWGDTAPYTGYFAYGDGGKVTFSNVTYTYKGFSHAFYPCSTKTFTQTLHVTDGAGGTANAYSTAKEQGGYPC